MAGMGLPPKPADKRARVNKDPIPTRVVHIVRADAPPLPSGHAWHPRTESWWEMWARSPLAADFTELDWAFLLETAVIHSAFWFGDLKQAPELRLRAAKFGITPEDRARLRIVFADADEKDEKRTGPQPQGTYGNLRAMRPASS